MSLANIRFQRLFDKHYAASGSGFHRDMASTYSRMIESGEMTPEMSEIMALSVWHHLQAERFSPDLDQAFRDVFHRTASPNLPALVAASRRPL